MKYDKERRDEVIQILSMMRNGEISKEEGERQLDSSYSPQLVETVRATLEEGWKPKVKIENQVHKQKREEVSLPTRALGFTVPLIGIYIVFAAGAHILGFDPNRPVPDYAPWLANPVLSRFAFGVLGLVFGFAAVRMMKSAVLLSALWAGAAGYVFGLWAAPLLLSALILVVCITQLAMKSQVLHSWLTAAGGTLCGGAAAFLVDAFAVNPDTVRLPDAVVRTAADNVNYANIGAGCLLALIGIILIIMGIKKTKT